MGRRVRHNTGEHCQGNVGSHKRPTSLPIRSNSIINTEFDRAQMDVFFTCALDKLNPHLDNPNYKLDDAVIENYFTRLKCLNDACIKTNYGRNRITKC